MVIIALRSAGRICLRRLLKIVLERQPPDLGVPRFHVHPRLAVSVATVRTKYLGRRFLKLGLAPGDPVRVDVEMLTSLGQRHLALDRC
jgi:hypothetical protein